MEANCGLVSRQNQILEITYFPLTMPLRSVGLLAVSLATLKGLLEHDNRKQRKTYQNDGN